MFGAIYYLFELVLHALAKIFRLRLSVEERRRIEEQERRATRRLVIVAVTTFVVGGVLLVFLMRYLDGISRR